MEKYESDSVFDTFFDNRLSLIIQYANGDITKKEFLEYNFNFIQDMNIKPFVKIDSYEKGMYNYQYYNTIAKYYKMLANDLWRSGDCGEEHIYYKQMGNEYYDKKDKSTYQFLRYLKFKNVEAYFVNVESKSLNNKLYEIVLLDYTEAIFHSKSLWLLEVLREENVFIEEKKDSIIDYYINQKY